MVKGRRALLESIESRQLLTSVSGLVWNDLNGDKIKDSREKWFSLDGVASDPAVSLYADLNGNGTLDATEPSTTVTKEGSYRINLSAGGPIAVRMTYSINPSKQKNTGIFGMVPVVIVNAGEDKTGVNVPLEKAGIVTGTMYTDENANGTLDTNEVKQGKSLVFFDDNDDGVRQNEEPFVPLGAATGSTDFKYTIPVPLGEGKLRVVRIFATDNVTIDPVTVTAEAGKLYTRDFRIVPEMVVSGRLFNDKDGNGKRTKGEAYVAGVRTWLDFNQNKLWEKDTEPSAVSDSGGNYSLLTRKSSATFGVNILFRSTPTTNITSTSKVTRIVFKSIQDTQSFNFGFKSAGIAVQIFNDPDASGSITSGDSPLQFMNVFLDLDGDGKQDTGEPSTLSGEDGIAKFEDLATTPAPKAYKVIVKYSSKFVKTSASSVFNLTLDPFEQEQLIFGVKRA